MALVAYCGSGEGGVWRTLFPCWAIAEDNGDLKEDGHMEGALPYVIPPSSRFILTYNRNGFILCAPRICLCKERQLIMRASPQIEAFIVLSWHYCDTTPNPEIASRTVEAAKAFGHRISGMVSSLDFVDCARHVEEQSKTVSLVRDTGAKCATLSDNLVHARSLVFLGVVLETTEQWSEALHTLSQATTFLKIVMNDANLAYAYQITAWLQDALAAVEDAWKYAELSDRPYIQVFVFQEYTCILFSADRDREAWARLELSLMMAAQVVHPLKPYGKLTVRYTFIVERMDDEQLFRQKGSGVCANDPGKRDVAEYNKILGCIRLDGALMERLVLGGLEPKIEFRRLSKLPVSYGRWQYDVAIDQSLWKLLGTAKGPSL
ncbi:hypothetical protein K443DRAFT_126018 [Laccaria amethystina LaAM-08-1]|uniref:Uncharacterized protein n=1 Tax=Laccaria amethystina LaAM-08-1 TaxID=1095629 RepID=A0A0C9X6W5_9AGAR|nr:hypothetical protein K443DRAFT_126018 [Laccaria amethystina LaAM-08-1]